MLPLSKYDGPFNTYKPKIGDTLPAVWLSSTQPGKLAYYIPEKPFFQIAADAQQIKDEFFQHFRSKIFADTRPDTDPFDDPNSDGIHFNINQFHRFNERLAIEALSAKKTYGTLQIDS